MEFWWLLLLLFFDTSLANSYFRKHKFWIPITYREPAPSTLLSLTLWSGFSSPPRGSKMILPIHEALGLCLGSFWRICLSCWKNPNLLHSPMESSPSAIGRLDPVLENCDVAVPHPKDAMIMNLGLEYLMIFAREHQDPAASMASYRWFKLKFSNDESPLTE